MQPCGGSIGQGIRRDIVEHDRSSADDRVVANPHARRQDRAGADEGVPADVHVARRMHAGREIGAVVDDAIVIQRGRRVDDDVDSQPAAGADRRLHAEYRAGADLDVVRDGRGPVNRGVRSIRIGDPRRRGHPHLVVADRDDDRRGARPFHQPVEAQKPAGPGRSRSRIAAVIEETRHLDECARSQDVSSTPLGPGAEVKTGRLVGNHECLGANFAARRRTRSIRPLR